MRDYRLYGLMTTSYVAHSMWFIKYAEQPNGSMERTFGMILFSVVVCLHAYFVRHEVEQLAATKGTSPYKIVMSHLLDPWNLQDLIRLTLVTVALLYYLILLLQSPNGKIYKGSKTTYSQWCEKHGFKWAGKEIPQSWIDEKEKVNFFG